ncbi:IS5/IS1182 family transposase, partial [Bacteroides fragilis]
VKTEFTLAAIAHNLRKLAKKVSALFFFTYFCRITSRKKIIEKNKDGFKIKMDNRRAA